MYSYLKYVYIQIDLGMNSGICELIPSNNKFFPKDKRSKNIMTKAQPYNVAIKSLYESPGFLETGFDDKNSNYIYHTSPSK